MSAAVIFIMGVAGSGKTTIGRLLSAAAGIPFFDGDDFHPETNRLKMQSGIPLTDGDRVGWLQSIHQKALEVSEEGGGIFACSALKQQYRDILQSGLPQVQWFYLEGDFDTVLQRMQQRSGHFMAPALLPSQFEILEPPACAVAISIVHPPEKIISMIMEHLQPLSEMGIIGLGVMGKSLARNVASKGITVSLYNRFVAGKEEKVAEKCILEYPELKNARGFEDLGEFVQSLRKPAKILLMVEAGDATDKVMQALIPLLSPGDLVLDGGNTHFKDTERRAAEMKGYGLHWMGCGVSGGEAGALSGPSLMPGGDAQVYAQVRPYLEAIAAKDYKGRPCCSYVGPGGAGHFVKMIHNGIEYAEMQLIAEVYYLLRKGLQFSPGEISEIFTQWNATPLSSYLLEITIDILRAKDANGWLIDAIADEAASKGTGSWATQTAAGMGVPATMLTSALNARFFSAERGLRRKGQEAFQWEKTTGFAITPELVQQAYGLARIINHQQGFHFIKTASAEFDWNIDLAGLAASWTNGCIIRSAMMETLAGMLQEDSLFLFLPAMVNQVHEQRDALVQTVTCALQAGLAVPALSDALQYLHALAENDSPMNLIQAQRDYFGAHTYRLRSDPDGQAVHTNWVAFGKKG